jgi:hypothetical protein
MKGGRGAGDVSEQKAPANGCTKPICRRQDNSSHKAGFSSGWGGHRRTSTQAAPTSGSGRDRAGRRLGGFPDKACHIQAQGEDISQTAAR